MQEEVPKELLLSSLNTVTYLKLENEQLEQLMEYNRGFVDKVHGVPDSEKEDKTKKNRWKPWATHGKQRST